MCVSWLPRNEAFFKTKGRAVATGKWRGRRPILEVKKKKKPSSKLKLQTEAVYVEKGEMNPAERSHPPYTPQKTSAKKC